MALPPDFRPLPASLAPVLVAAAHGDCPAYFFTPSGEGPWPGVLFLMDGFGMRPTIAEMAQRIADCGYAVLLPDLFYRHGRYDPLDVRAAFAGGAMRQAVFDRVGASPSVPMVLADAPALLAFLAAQPQVAKGGIAVVGYCMSGGMALAIAGTHAAAVAAAACFHGGILVSDAEASPHRLVADARGEIYIGGAAVDEWCPPAMVDEVAKVLATKGVAHIAEIYDGTMHGWTMRDSPSYNEPAAERHWHKLLELLTRALGGVGSGVPEEHRAS